MSDFKLGRAIYELIADDQGLSKGLDAAKAKSEGWASGMAGIGKAGAIAMATVAAGVSAVTGVLIASAVAVAHDAGEVSKLKRELGLTSDQASRLSYEGKRLNLDTDALSKSFGIFSKNVVAANYDLSAHHIEVVRNKDGQVDFEKTLANTADRFKSMPDGVDKTALSMQLFGKTGKDLLPLLNQGADGLKAMGVEAEKLGLVFDDKTLASAKRLSMAHKDLDDRVEGLRNRIGIAFLPTLADWTGGLVKAADVVLPSVSSALEIVTGWMGKGIEAIKGPASAALALATDAVKAFVDLWRGGDVEIGNFADTFARIFGVRIPESVLQMTGVIVGELRRIPGFVAQVAGSIGEIFDVATGRRPEAGGILRSLVGDVKAAEIMGVVGRVRTAMTEAFDVVKPVVQGVIDKVVELKAKFDDLPPAIQAFAAAAVVGQVTGFNDQLLSMAANAAQAGGGAIALAKQIGIMGLAMNAVGLDGFILQLMYLAGGISAGAVAIGGFLVAAAPFILLAALIGIAIYLLVTHWNELGDTIGMIGAILGHFIGVAGAAIMDFLGFWSMVWTRITSDPVTWFGELVGFLFGSLLNLAQAIGDFAGNALSTVTGWLGNLGAAWDAFWNGDMPLKLGIALVQILAGIAQFGVDLWNSVTKAMGDLIKWLGDEWGKLPDKMLDIGRAIVEGVWHGIQNAAGFFTDQVRNFFLGIIDGVKHALGISSPSAVFAEMGLQMTAGLTQGITAGADEVRKALLFSNDVRVFGVPVGTVTATAGGASSYATRTPFLSPRLASAPSAPSLPSYEPFRSPNLGFDALSGKANADHGHPIIVDGQQLAQASGQSNMRGASVAGRPLG